MRTSVSKSIARPSERVARTRSVREVLANGVSTGEPAEIAGARNSARRKEGHGMLGCRLLALCQNCSRAEQSDGNR